MNKDKEKEIENLEDLLIKPREIELSFSQMDCSIVSGTTT